MSVENEVRITLTDVYNAQQQQAKEFTKAMADQSEKFNAGLASINTSLAVLAKSVEPQSGINSELFKRVLAVEKKVWQLPSVAALVGIAGIIIAVVK